MGKATIGPLALALDIGTSSVRATLFDTRGRALPGSTSAAQHQPITTPEGGAELDADRLLDAALGCVRGALDGAGGRAREVAAVGVCTLWHSLLGVGRDGAAVTPIYLWSDTRSVAQVKRLRDQLDERAVHARTGCRFHTSYLPARLLWIAETERERFRAAARWVSPGEYLFLKLFGEGSCSLSMASGTGLLNHGTEAWDAELLGALPVNVKQLSPILPDDALARGLREPFASRVPQLRQAAWLPARGDGACSNLGSGCGDEDRVSLMIGTSGAMRVTLTRPPSSVPFGLWHYRLDRRRHLVGGALTNGGSLASWMLSTLRLESPDDLDGAVRSLEPDGHGLTVLPFLSGERCPNWRGEARAAIIGLSQHTSAAEIARAGLEAVAYRFASVHDLLVPMARPGHQLLASGRALLSTPTWLRILANVLGRPLTPLRESEASSRGAALLALEAIGAVSAVAAPEPEFGDPVEPEPAAQQTYAAARARHERLYRRLIAESS